MNVRERDRNATTLLVCILALLAGCALAWIDTRPHWDDTGMLVGLLFLSSALVGALGAPWWLTAILTSGPMLCVEFRALGSAILLPPAIAVGGALLGAGVRRALRGPIEHSEANSDR